jgi:hypothetical protein
MLLDMNALPVNTLRDYPVRDFGLTGIQARPERKESAKGGSLIPAPKSNV